MRIPGSTILVWAQALTLTLTSGSSGKPKAVVHTVADHLANAKGVCELMAFSHTDSWLLSLPLFHVSGQGIVWRWLLQGATLQICEDKCDFMDGLDKVTPSDILDGTDRAARLICGINA